MAVTVPATAAVVLYAQGANNALLPGGNRIVPAVVISAVALVVTLKALAPETDAIFTGVQHSSVAAIGAASWSWTAASGNSNS
jgi:hypothetical protein